MVLRTHLCCRLNSQLSYWYIMCNYEGKYRQVDKASLVIFVFGIPIPSSEKAADMDFVQKFTPSDFQAKNFTLSISPNFNSFRGGGNTKNEWKWRNLHRWQKFYTAAGTDGMDKFHLWSTSSSSKP